MNKKQIRDFVQTVAEIKDLTPVKTPSIRLDETHQNDVRIGDEWHHLDQTNNPTLGFTLVRLKDQHRLCELGCGEIATNQVIEKKLYFTPQRHWRTKCLTCGKWLGPNGVDLVDSRVAHNTFTVFWNKQKSKL